MTKPAPVPDDRIVDAIVGVWVLDGVAAVTHRRVAEAAGVSKGKLQHLYPTGGDLIAAGVGRLILPPRGPGLMWGQLEFAVHRLLGLREGYSDEGVAPDVPTAVALAQVEAYVWAARHVV